MPTPCPLCAHRGLPPAPTPRSQRPDPCAHSVLTEARPLHPFRTHRSKGSDLLDVLLIALGAGGPARSPSRVPKSVVVLQRVLCWTRDDSLGKKGMSAPVCITRCHHSPPPQLKKHINLTTSTCPCVHMYSQLPERLSKPRLGDPTPLSTATASLTSHLTSSRTPNHSSSMP